TCLAPTAPAEILARPTEFGLSLALPTEKFWSWAFPTLFGGSRSAAQPTPPSATNRARNETTSAAEGRRGVSERRLIEPPPGVGRSRWNAIRACPPAGRGESARPERHGAPGRPRAPPGRPRAPPRGRPRPPAGPARPREA